MTHGQPRPTGYDRDTARQRWLPPRLLKDNGCRECRTRTSPTDAANAPREPCPHKREFAPTANRFSVLAQLDQQPNQTKWAFDFVQTPNHGSQRRGRRGGKNSKPKPAKQPPQEGSKGGSESLEELRNEIAAQAQTAIPQNASMPQSGIPQANFTFSADGARHNWLRQFGPNPQVVQSSSSPLTPTSPAKPVTPEKIHFPQPPERCLTQSKGPTTPFEMPEFDRKQSRFFPLSAFLATSDTATWHPSSPRLPALVKARPPLPRNLSIAIPSAAQEAAAAAHRALAVQNSAAISRPSLFAPRITRSSPASPTLNTSPATSTLPSLPSPSLSSTPPPPLPRRPLLSPTEPAVLQANPSTSPLSLPRTSPHLPIPSHPQQLSDFLKLGHGNPCWCTAHSSWDFPPPPLSALQLQPTTPPREDSSSSSSEVSEFEDVYATDDDDENEEEGEWIFVCEKEEEEEEEEEWPSLLDAVGVNVKSMRAGMGMGTRRQCGGETWDWIAV